MTSTTSPSITPPARSRNAAASAAPADSHPADKRAHDVRPHSKSSPVVASSGTIAHPVAAVASDAPGAGVSSAARGSIWGRVAVFAYGIFAYAWGMATLVYLIGFTTGWIVPKDVNGGPVGSLSMALVINTLLVAAFAVQHEIMARPWFKARLTTILPKSMERSTFVLVASIILTVLFWQWRPMPYDLWRLEGVWTWGIYVAALVGWVIAFGSTFIIDHFDLFGLRHVFLHLKGEKYTRVRFKERLFYRLCRHPLMLGFVIAFWATPVMTLGHLWFAVLMTTFILAGIQFEERDLVREHGRAYEDYRDRVPGLIPVPAKWRRRRRAEGMANIAG